MAWNYVELNKMRNKWYGLALASVLIGLSLITTYFAYRAFDDLDRQHFAENYRRLDKVLQNQTRLYLSKLNDWTMWNELYDYVQKPNPEFIKDNVSLSNLKALDLKGVAILDDQGRILSSQMLTVRAQGETAIEWDPARRSLVNPQSKVISESLNKEHWAYSVVDGAAYLMAVKGISNGNGTAPKKGRLVFLYEINDNFVQNVESQVQLPTRFNLQRSQSADLPVASYALDESGGGIEVFENQALIHFKIKSEADQGVGEFTIVEKRDATILGSHELVKTLVFQCIAAILIGIGLQYAMTSTQLRYELILTKDKSESVEAREKYVRSILQDLPLSFFLFARNEKNNDLQLEDYKHEAGRGLSLDSKLFTGRGLHDLSEIFTPDAMKFIMEFNRSESRSSHFEFFHEGTSGPKKWLMSLSKQGLSQKVMIAMLDVSEKWLMEKKLEKDHQIMIQNARMAALGEMAKGLAHEINNPLTIIVLNLRNIRRKVEDDERFQWMAQSLNNMETNANRVSLIIRGLKNFSRDSQNDPISVISPAGVIDETLALCRERLKKQGIKISVEVDSPEFHIESRGPQLSQVLMNLLTNSLDAIEGHENPWIKIRVVRVESRMQIRVLDSGGGIDAAVVDRMMNPFFTTKDVGKGTGLGLSISKGLVESHGGRLFYNSEGVNTEFVIEVPCVDERGRMAS